MSAPHQNNDDFTMKNSGSRTIAQRYVKALFDVATERKIGAGVEKDLLALGSIYGGSDIFRALLLNPLLTRAQLAGAMKSVLGAIDAESTTVEFIELLAREKRLALLPEIAAIYAEMAAAARGEITAELTSAVPLKAPEINTISKQLGQAYGGKVNVIARQDASLLAGAVVKIGSTRIDSSLAGKLRRLGNKLKAA